MDEQQKIEFNTMCSDIGLTDADLQKKLQESPVKEETFILWTEYNKRSNELAQSHQWASFRDMRKKMHEFLLFEGKEMPALIMLLQVVHLDLNGPRDTGAVKDGKADLSSELPFDRTLSALDNSRVKEVTRLNKKLNLSIEQLKDIYLDTIVRTNNQPLEVSDTWDKLEEKLKTMI